MAKITLSQVGKHFGDDVAVHPLDLDLADGSLTVLVGPSGCGKTTTLRMIAGLETASSGTIQIGDREVTGLEPRDRNVAMVFQNFALYPHLNVGRNIGFGLEARRVPRDEIDRKVRDAAQMLDIEHVLDRKSSALSGGQQQRVAIARAIVREPDVFLFDEPLSNLDAKLRVETRTELLRLQRRLQATMVYVTHDQEEAMILADDLIVMNEGRIQQSGRPTEIFRRPINEFVARFIGSPEINLFEGQVRDGRFTAPSVEVPLAGVADGEARLGVRPDDVRRSGVIPEQHAVGHLKATVDVIEVLGASAVLYLHIGGDELRAVVGEGEVDDLDEGDEIEMAFDQRRLHAFDVATGQRISA